MQDGEHSGVQARHRPLAGFADVHLAKPAQNQHFLKESRFLEATLDSDKVISKKLPHGKLLP